jgi:hypothetical protein
MRIARRVVALIVVLAAALAVPASSAPALSASDGYWLLDAEGVVYGFGAAAGFTETRPTPHARPAVAIAPTPTARGYVILWADGSVSSHGDADFGDVRIPLEPGERPTAIAVTPTGTGLWVFTSFGHVRAVGTAISLGGVDAALNGDVVAAVPTRSGRGYYHVGTDGGVFAFGDATYHGSMGGRPLNAPVIGLIPTPGGGGYLLVARDGGIFAFGRASFYGSMGGVPLNQPIVGAVGSGGGYLLVAADGGIFAFGPTAFHGSLGSNPPPAPVVAVAALPDTPDVAPPVTPPVTGSVVDQVAAAATAAGLTPLDFAFAVDPSHGGWADALELIGDEMAYIESGVPADLIQFGWDNLLQTGEVTVRQHAVLTWSLGEAQTLRDRGFTSTDLGAA